MTGFKLSGENTFVIHYYYPKYLLENLNMAFSPPDYLNQKKGRGLIW